LNKNIFNMYVCVLRRIAMEKTFKDKILSLYRRTIQKHPKLKGPMMVLSVFLLAIDRIALNIRLRTRKLVTVMIVLVFSFISCSYTSSILGEGQSDFTDKSPAYYEETEGSIAKLAIEADIDESNIIEDDAEETEDAYENVIDISEVDTVSGADILDAVDLAAIETEESTGQEQTGDESEVTFTRDDWQLVLVNKNHPISDNYEFTLGTIKGSMQCDERILADLYSMLDAAYKDGVNLVICSPYRADERQEMLFSRKVNRYMSQGMSYMDSYKLASQAVTIPGSSEHQIGLALDMVCDGYSALDSGFGDTPAGQWLAAHSQEYGFVIRYPLGKEDITGIEYEPWHLRYVGKNAASVMASENLCLEEFWEKYL